MLNHKLDVFHTICRCIGITLKSYVHTELNQSLYMNKRCWLFDFQICTTSTFFFHINQYITQKKQYFIQELGDKSWYILISVSLILIFLTCPTWLRLVNRSTCQLFPLPYSLISNLSSTYIVFDLWSVITRMRIGF